MLKIDEAWFEAYKNCTRHLPQTFAALEPTPSELTLLWQEFKHSNFSANLSLYPNKNVQTGLKKTLEDLDELRRQIYERETNTLVKEQYVAAINETSLNIQLICAAAQRNDVEYARLNKQLYGQPKQEIFAASCAFIHSTLDEHVSQPTHIGELARRVAALLPKAELKSSNVALLPSEDVFSQVKALHYQPGGYFDTLFDGEMPDSAYVNQREGDEWCQKSLHAIGAKNYIIKDSPTVTWAVDTEAEIVYRPVGYRLSRDDFIGIVAHEIGSHILEAVNGARSPLKLLGSGLAGYLNGNEGRALVREQIVYPSCAVAARQLPWEYNILKHLSVCLALSYAGPCTFSQLYLTLKALFHFWRERRHPLETNNEEVATEQAWYLAVRIMKGTNGLGGCYVKDIVYLEANIALWQIAKTKPEHILYGDNGKFNVLNKNQCAAVERLIAS
ncbi:DUF1704 domain-containing protein [Candidatus Saccharibacteria bacterium]|nr:DUF1704 domain-containing protein [Candidatus Saccharibacteria bacterium]